MARLFLLLFLVAASALTAAAQSGRKITTARSTPIAPIQPPLNPAPEAPSVSEPSALLLLPDSLRVRQIKSLDSGSFRFADFRGKVIVINLWASWCGPCRREVPEYEKIRNAFAGREVEFIGLTTEDPQTSAGRVKKFLRNTSFSFRLGWADPATARTLMNGKESIPQTLVIDADGRVVDHWTGYIPRISGDKLTAAINQALEAEVSAVSR
jgi:thiol-disulfide isomerase/thioredoxin